MEPAIRSLPAGRPNRFTIDLGAIAHNVGVLRTLIGRGTFLVAAVKANAYGMGLRAVAPVLRDAGVDALAMVDVRDAVTLRKDGIRLPILLYGGNLVDECLVRAVEEHELTMTVPDWESAVAISRIASRTIPVYAEVDVGLERLGFPAVNAEETIRQVDDLPNLQLRGIYTHMHLPRTGNSMAYVEWQFDRFQTLLRGLDKGGTRRLATIAASSDVLALTSEMDLNGVDVGKMLYATIRTARGIDLRSAFHSLTSRLTHIATVERHEYADQAPFPLYPGMRLGIVPIGIADGLLALTCRSALIRGQRATVVGEPSMEHCRLDVTGIDGAMVGDEVVFVGTQGSDEIRLADLPLCEDGATTWRAALEIRDSVQRVYLPVSATRSCQEQRGELV
jgi:alanine racemase